MSQKQKLISRLTSNPKDFTFDDAKTLLEYFGYIQNNKGKTSGSRVMFTNSITNVSIRLHKPHPDNILRNYQVKQLVDHLSQEGLL